MSFWNRRINASFVFVIIAFSALLGLGLGDVIWEFVLQG